MRRCHAFKVIFLIAILMLSASAVAETAFTNIWGGYGTSLVTRSQQQRHNTIMAAKDLDGIIIPPGGIFSFNAIVGARDSGKGYTAAPIIDSSGQLQDSPGGGICQLASTIYNAGLLAGMQVIERHPHSRSVGHVPPGRDATISSWRKDLKLKNSFSHPLQLRIDAGKSRLTASFRATEPKTFSVEITTEKSRVEPETVVRGSGSKTLQHGISGYSTITRRIIRKGRDIREEVVSEDRYPAPSRIIGDATEDTKGSE